MKINGLNDTNRLEGLRSDNAKAPAKPPAHASAGTLSAAAAPVPSTASATIPAAAPPAAPSTAVALSASVAHSSLPFDTAKVDRIKEAIRNGEFQINSEAVAHQLLSSVSSLFGRAH